MNLLVVLADGWGYTQGGINVFNREMCRGFGGYVNEKFRVLCLAPEISRAEVDIAKQNEKLDLIGLSRSEFDNPEDIVSKVRQYCDLNSFENLSVTWLGHDTYSDLQAIECKKLWKDSRCAIIHHMSYSTYYPLVNLDSEKTQEKESNQRARLRAADLVFANGPLLKRSAQDLRGSKENVFEILPGVYEVKDVKQTFTPDTFYVVTFGRVEPAQGTKRNNSIIKQVFLAAASWSKFTNTLRTNQESVMTVYGKSGDGVENEVMDIVKKHFKDVHSFTMVPYESDHAKLLEKLSDYSLCLVLSSKEGFGLTAIEAISAGVPIIVSQSSGFYQSLYEKSLDGYVHSIRVEASLDEPYYTKGDLERATKEIEEVYCSQENAKKKTIKLREELIKAGFTWENCAKTIIEKLGWLDEASTNEASRGLIANTEVKKTFSLAEKIILGKELEDECSIVNDINDAFEMARQYYLSCIKPFTRTNLSYDKKQFQNIGPHDTSIRFLHSQELYNATYTVQSLYLDVVEATKYGFNYVDCIPSILWEDEYQCSDWERKLIDEAEKAYNQLINHSIPKGEINQYSLVALLKEGYSFNDLFEMQYDLDAIVRFGIDKEELEKYYSKEDVSNAERRAEELFNIIKSPALAKYEKYGPKYLAKKFCCQDVLAVFPIEEISHAFDVDYILSIQPMATVKELKKGGYNAEELFDSGFSLRQLKAAGYDAESLICHSHVTGDFDSKAIKTIVEDTIFEIEEEDYKEDFLCGSEYAELLKRLKEKRLKLTQIKEYLPFKLESCPKHIKWLFMARFTVDELEIEKYDWNKYFIDLPSEWIDNNEYINYQYDGVLPIELLKSGISAEQIESSYSINGLKKELDELMKIDVVELRSCGYTAKAFFHMGKTLEEIITSYSFDKDEDVREMALSGYGLRELRKAGFSIGSLKKQYSGVLLQYDLQGDSSPWSRYGMILDFISKHGE